MTATIKATKTTKATTILKAKKLSSTRNALNQNSGNNIVNMITPDNWDDIEEDNDLFCRVLSKEIAMNGSLDARFSLTSEDNWDTYQSVQTDNDPACDDDVKKTSFNQQRIISSVEQKPSISKLEIREKPLAPTSIPVVEYFGFKFAKEMETRIFFEPFLHYLNCSSFERYTPMQHELLESLLAGNHFQVLSGCGTGKSFVTVTAFVGLLYETHTLIWVYDRPEQHQQLREQVVAQALGASGNLAKVIDVGSSVYRGTLLPPNVEENGLILTPAKKLLAVIERLSRGQKKLLFLFDEAQSIFTADQRRMAADYEQQLQEQLDQPADSSSVARARAAPPLMHMIKEAMLLSQSSGCDYQMVFLSAVAKRMTARDIQPAEVIEEFVRAHKKKDDARSFQSLDASSKHNNLHETYIVEFHCHQGIYEQMAHLMLMYLTPGRNLVICRPQQVQPIVDFIISSDPTITVTSDMDYWMDPRFSVVIVREHELKSLEGVDIPGLTGVFLLTIAHEAVVHRNFQTVGRVGRLGQAATRAFVFMDKTNWKQSRREAASQEHLRRFILENHEAVEVAVENAQSSLAAIRCPRRSQPVNAPAAVVTEARQLNEVANKIHVCPFSVFDGAGKTYLCPRQGTGCRMHHPLLEELTWYRGRAYLNGAHYKTTGRTPDCYRSAECRCSNRNSNDDDTVCDANVCIMHARSRAAASSSSSSRTSAAKPAFKNKFIQYPKGVSSDSREGDARSETSLSSCSTRCVSIAAPAAAAALASAAAVQKPNAWEKPLLGICAEKSTPPVAAETSAPPAEARRVSAWDKSPSLLFDSPRPGPGAHAIEPEAVAVAQQKPVVSHSSAHGRVREEVPAMELCQNCFFYGQCNRHPSRLHLHDSGFAAAAEAFEKTFAETKVCLKGFFEPEKCKFGSACHRLHKGDARLTAGVIAAFRSFYIRTTAQLSGRPLSSCRVNRSHDIRFCYFLHKEDSCSGGGSTANHHVCRHPAAAAEKKEKKEEKEKKGGRVAHSNSNSDRKAAAAMKSLFAALDESSDTDENGSEDEDEDELVAKNKMADARLAPFPSSNLPALAKTGVTGVRTGVSKALGAATSWAAMTDSDDEDDYEDDAVAR